MSTVNTEAIKKKFWQSKGIENPETLSMEEKRAFVEELKAFRDGFVSGYNEGYQTGATNQSQQDRRKL